MKILIVTNHFFPETFRVNDIAFDMSSRGHDVTVLTAIPDYPLGHYFKGYGLTKRRMETLNGVKVVRAAVIPRGNGNMGRMVLNYASSLISFCFWAFLLACRHRYDVVYIHDTSPATVCLPALLVKLMRKTPIVLWILDMWPESLIAGGVRNRKLFAVIDGMMRFVYGKCSRIQISSQGFRQLLVSRGVDKNMIEYLPNWSDNAMGCGETVDVELPDNGFIVMFAGNLGEAQNLENVMKAALMTKDRQNIQWVFLGDGRKRAWMEDFVDGNGLRSTVHLYGRRPMNEMPAYFAKADLMLVSLCDEVVFNLTLPAKVQAYMSNAKPIIAFANGETSEVIGKSECGWSVSPDSYQRLASLVKRLSEMPVCELKEKGRRGLAYYRENFTRETCMRKVETTMKAVVRKETI